MARRAVAPLQDFAKDSYKISEVARMFGVIVQTVHFWLRSGRVRRFNRTSRKGSYLIPRAEVARLLEASGREVPGIWEKDRARVLVIDDDRGIRSLAQAAARAHAFPMIVETAATVEDGMVLAGRFEPDVILLDDFFSQDLLSGEQGLAFIRHARALRSSAVVAMPHDERSAARMTKAGADAVLMKPFGLAELRTVIYRQWKARAATTVDA